VLTATVEWEHEGTGTIASVEVAGGIVAADIVGDCPTAATEVDAAVS
jgi:hypothetical protein